MAVYNPPRRQGFKIIADSTLLTVRTQSSPPRICIDAPNRSDQLPYADYRYAFKISPVTPLSFACKKIR
ncbi:hypothetical protein ACQ86N_10945 [Puia sp. P3]|uniref:hypothetical protein n=1 Tax=Puia sp. P3 TaxID=3423952 RepID=UPI003D6700BF